MQRIEKVAGLAACLTLAACGGGAATGSHSGDLTAAGEAARYEGPIASADVERGAEQFDVFCGTCHPDGEEDIGPALLQKRFPAAYVRKMVREGSGRMRPIPIARLQDDDLEAVLAYMVGIEAVAGEPAEVADAAGAADAE